MNDRVETLEHLVLGTQAGRKQAEHGHSEFQPKIIKDKTNQIKLEDTLIDYMEIIISLNAKMNNHIQTTRGDIQNIESKVQAMTVGSYLQNPLEVPK